MNERRYRVDLAPAAQRQLSKLPPGAVAQLRGPILALAIDPRSGGAAKLTGSEFWRIRAGAFRHVYAIDESRQAVIVVRVARRSESTYRRIR